MSRSTKRNREAAEVVFEKPELISEAPEQHTRGKRRRKGANEDSHGEAVDVRKTAIPISEKMDGGESLKRKPLKEEGHAKSAKKHVRFGSNSPPPVLESRDETKATNEAPAAAPEESDDDEAPEAISMSQAAATRLVAQKEEASVLKKREKEAREKRKRRAERLTQQSNASAKRKHVSKVEEPEITSSNELPDLLPEELLATEAPARPPTPPPFVIDKNPSPVGTKTIWKTEEEAKSKDLILNNTKIRLLRTENKLLAPKASNETREIREAWLRGVQSIQKPQGKTGELPKVRRRAFKQAFV